MTGLKRVADRLQHIPHILPTAMNPPSFVFTATLIGHRRKPSQRCDGFGA
jgi:hypothetical protein